MCATRSLCVSGCFACSRASYTATRPGVQRSPASRIFSRICSRASLTVQDPTIRFSDEHTIIGYNRPPGLQWSRVGSVWYAVAGVGGTFTLAALGSRIYPAMKLQVQPLSSGRRSSAVDRAGIVATTLCAVHCAIIALLPGAVALLGLTMLLDETVELGFQAAAILFAAAALAIGFRRRRSWAVLIALGAGIGGMVLSRYLEESGAHLAGTALTVASGASLIAGHLWNIWGEGQDA